MYMYTINIQQVTLFNKDFSMILYFLLLRFCFFNIFPTQCLLTNILVNLLAFYQKLQLVLHTFLDVLFTINTLVTDEALLYASCIQHFFCSYCLGNSFFFLFFFYLL